jgi:hypothetical protein
VSQLDLWLKARNPDTFSGFILHKMAFDRDFRLSMFADKVKVKEYVKDLAGDKYLIKNILVSNYKLMEDGALAAIMDFCVA